MPRFHFQKKDLQQGEVLLSPEETHHASGVYRLDRGDVVELLDGEGGVFRGVVLGLEGNQLRIAVEIKMNPQPGSAAIVTLGMAVIKPAAMEWMIEKACELGASAIAPLITARCVVRLPEARWALKATRWRKIIRESCKQCGRATTPELFDPMPFSAFMKTATSYNPIFIPTLAAETKSMVTALPPAPPKHMLLLIGPEGDFTPQEVEEAFILGAHPVSLGPWVLRSETAALYALSAVNFYYSQMMALSKP